MIIIANTYGNDSVPGTGLSNLILPTTLQGKYCYYHSHLSGEKTKVQGEIKLLIQGHTDRKWQSQDSNLSSLLVLSLAIWYDRHDRNKVDAQWRLCFLPFLERKGHSVGTGLEAAQCPPLHYIWSKNIILIMASVSQSPWCPRESFAC